MRLGSDPPALVAASITFGAGASATLVCEGEASPFFITIGAVAGLSTVFVLVAGKELETFVELFVSGSVFVAEVSALSVPVVSGCADFTPAFGCKVVCGFDEDIAIEGGVEDCAG
jgi:hypothetical protein